MEITTTRPLWRGQFKLRSSSGAFGSSFLSNKVVHGHTENDDQLLDE